MKLLHDYEISSSNFRDINEKRVQDANDKLKIAIKELDDYHDENDVVGKDKDRLEKKVKQLQDKIKMLKDPEIRNKTAVCTIKKNKMITAFREVRIRQKLVKPILERVIDKCKNEESCDAKKLDAKLTAFMDAWTGNCR